MKSNQNQESTMQNCPYASRKERRCNTYLYIITIYNFALQHGSFQYTEENTFSLSGYTFNNGNLEK